MCRIYHNDCSYAYQIMFFIQDYVPRSKQKEQLTDYLHDQSCEIFVKFCCVLIDLDRRDIIEKVFKLEVDHIKQQRGKFHMVTNR